MTLSLKLVAFLELIDSPIPVATFTSLCLVESALFLWSSRPCIMHRETSHPLCHWTLRTWRIWRRRRCRAHMSSCCSSRTLTTSSKSHYTSHSYSFIWKSVKQLILKASSLSPVMSHFFENGDWYKARAVRRCRVRRINIAQIEKPNSKSIS